MAELLKIADNRDGYTDVIDYVRRMGRKQPSRNGDTLEVDDLIIELADPSKSIPCGIGRAGFNSALGPMEALQLIGGFVDSRALLKITPNMARFMEQDSAGNPLHFHGGYGHRTGQQFPTVLDRLLTDDERDTRQCVVTFWDPRLDSKGGKKDHPCTIAANFRIRDEKLLMSTYMRSNDAHWGWPYDAVAFTGLQLSIAYWLDIEPGPYTHHAASFHIYTKDLEALESLTPWDGTDERVRPFISSDEDQRSWGDVQTSAQRLMDLIWEEDAVPNPNVWSDESLWYFNSIAKRVRA